MYVYCCDWFASMLRSCGETGGNLEAGLHGFVVASTASAGAASRGCDSIAKLKTDDEQRVATRATLQKLWAKSMAPVISDQ
jgi:hypothetical protein